MEAGKLHLLPCPIADQTYHTLPDYVKDKMRSLDFFICERAKTARRTLISINHPKSFDEIEIFEIDKRDVLKDKDEWLIPLLNGKEMGLLSEAGLPCIADPGEAIVALAHQVKAEVIPYVGPSSIILALIASGLNGEQFQFHTYLPIKEPELSKKIKMMIQQVQKENSSQIFIETPYRNVKLFKLLLSRCPNNLYLSLAIDITSANERIITKSVGNWKKAGKIDIHKKPCVFVLGNMSTGT